MAASLMRIIQKLKKINKKAEFHTQCIKLADSKFLKNKFKISNYKKAEILELCQLHPAFARRLVLLIDKAHQLPITLDNQNVSAKEISRLHPNDFQVQLVATGNISKKRIPVVIQFLDPDKCGEAKKNFFVLFDNYAHLISDPIELTQYEFCIKKQIFHEENLSRSLLAILSDEEIAPLKKHKDKNIPCSSDVLITTIHISVAKEVLTPSFVKVLLSFLGLSRNISQEINTSAIIKRINDPQETENNKLDLIEILLAKRVFQRQYWKDLTQQEYESLTAYLKDKKDIRYIKLYNMAIERTKFLNKNKPNFPVNSHQAESKPNPASFEQINISDNHDSPIVPAAALNDEPIIPSSDEIKKVIENSNLEKPSVRIDLSSLNLERQDKGETHSKAANNFQRTNSTNKLLDLLYKNNFKTNNQDIVDAVSSNLSQNALSLEQSQSSTTQEGFNNSQINSVAALNNDSIVSLSNQVNEVIENSYPHKLSVRIDLSSLHLEGKDKAENHLKATNNFQRTNSTNKLLDLLYKNNFKTNNQDIVDAVSSNLSQNAFSLELSESSTAQGKVNNNQTAPSFAITLDSQVNTTAFTGKQALTLDQSKQTLTFEHSKQALTLDQSKQALTLEQSIQALTLSSSNNALTLDSSSSTPSKKNENSFIELSIDDGNIDENIDGNDNFHCLALYDESTARKCSTPTNNVLPPLVLPDLGFSPIMLKFNLEAENNNSRPDLNKLQTQFKKTFQEIMNASEQSPSNINKLDNSTASISTSNAKDQTQLNDSFSQAALSISCDKEEKNSLDNSENASDLSAISFSTGTPVPSPIKQRVN